MSSSGPGGFVRTWGLVAARREREAVVLVRDRDRVYGPAFKDRVECMGIEGVLTSPRSPWQNPFAERVIGSIRRERLDHVVVLSETHLRRLLADYLQHYHRWRCYRSLAMDCPSP